MLTGSLKDGGIRAGLDDFDFYFLVGLSVELDGAMEDSAIVEAGVNIAQEISGGERGAGRVHFDGDGAELGFEQDADGRWHLRNNAQGRKKQKGSKECQNAFHDSNMKPQMDEN